MNASEGVVGLKSTSFSTTGGAVFVAGTPFSPRQVGVGERAQSSEYFAPVHRRSTVSPGIGSGTGPRCPYATRSTTAPVSSTTRITPPSSGTGMSYTRSAHAGSPTTLCWPGLRVPRPVRSSANASISSRYPAREIGEPPYAAISTASAPAGASWNSVASTRSIRSREQYRSRFPPARRSLHATYTPKPSDTTAGSVCSVASSPGTAFESVSSTLGSVPGVPSPHVAPPTPEVV